MTQCPNCDGAFPVARKSGRLPKSQAPVERVFEPPGPVARAFMESEAYVRFIMGPIGSGKTVVCANEALRRSAYFPKGPDGIRRPRGIIVRNTYPDLRETTIKSWLQWCPPSAGRMTMQAPLTHQVKFADVELEVTFLAMDREEDVRKLLGAEATWIWFNEVRFIPKSIIDVAVGRVGRWKPYPGTKDTWAGVFGDTNPPDTENWYYKLAEGIDEEVLKEAAKLEEELRKLGRLAPGQKLYEFFRQPSGLSPQAENLQNLDTGYYHINAANKTEDYVKVYIHGEYGFLVEGKPVHPSYRDGVHGDKKVDPIPGLPVLVGADFGLTPAAAFGQCLPNGQWRVFAEVTTDRAGIRRFGQALKTFMSTHYPDLVVGGAWGDPSGTAGDEGETAFDILKTETGWNWKPAPTNDAEIRREALRGPLARMIDGEPGILVSSTCGKIRKGLVSGFHYKFMASSNGAVTHDQPAKNSYSHVCEALEYLVLGGGEYDVVHQRDPKRRGQGPKIAAGVGADPLADERPTPRQGRFETAADIEAWRNRRGRPRISAGVARGRDDDVLL